MTDGLADADAAEASLALRIAKAPPGEARDAESDLYRLLAPRVRRYGLRHLRDTHAADDLMQNVMALTLEHLRNGQVRQPERVVSFVFGTCRMVVMELRRGAQRREELLASHADMLEIAESPLPRGWTTSGSLSAWSVWPSASARCW